MTWALKVNSPPYSDSSKGAKTNAIPLNLVKILCDDWVLPSYRLKPAGLFILALPQNEAKTLGCSDGLTLRELEKPTTAKLALPSCFSR